MTDLIRTALEWVRAVLVGPRTPGRHARTPGRPEAARMAPSLYVCGARLIGARSLRPKPPAQPSEPCEPPGALVRPYIAQLDVMFRTARAGAPVDRWGNA